MARIIIVDDHQIFREGIASLISESEQDELVGTLAETRDIDASIRSLKADVVLLDLSLGKRLTYPDISHLKQAFPKLIVIVLSMHDDQVYVEKAMQAGADGYALKSDAFNDLLFAVRAAERGGRFISPSIISHGNISIALDKPDLQAMPERQRQILSLLAQGKSNKQIAASLGIALPTVKNHMTLLFKKNGVTNRVGLLAKLNMIEHNI